MWCATATTARKTLVSASPRFRGENLPGGYVEIGATAAILLIVGAWVLVDQLQWWDAWPWWGKTLFVLGAIAAYAIGASWEKSRDRPQA